MILAVLSDVHGNHHALAACLAEAKARGAEHCLFLGDYVTDGAYPERTLALLRETARQVPCTFIRGNREEYMLSRRAGGETHWGRDSATGSLLYTYENLTPEDLDWFASLENHATVALPGAPAIFLCHGTPQASRGNLKEDNPATPGLLAELPQPVVLCGHSHHQYAYRRWGKLVVNPGSVGANADGVGKLAYMALLHVEGDAVEEELLQVPYDWEAALRELEDSGLARRAPVWTRMVAELIRTGVNYCISVPTRAHEEYLRDTGQDVPWHEVPEEYWINAAAQAGLVI